MNKKQIRTIFLFQFKLGKLLKQLAISMKCLALGPLTNVLRNDGLKNFEAMTKTLKTMSAIVDHQMLTIMT